MKSFAAFAVLLLSAVNIFAQVTVEVVPAQFQFLPNESIPVVARVANFSGQTLHLGEDGTWLKFSVEARDGFIVPQLGDVPVQNAFTLDSSKRAKIPADLAPCFNLTRPGRYTLAATVFVKELGQYFTSRPVDIDIVSASKLWEQEFGVPGSGEVRRYTLQQANQLKHLKLYVRVSGAGEAKVLRVFPLGAIVSFSEPEPKLDKQSRLHVLWQTGSKDFAYRVINPDGELIVSQTYEYIGQRPQLRVLEDGQIVVAGGMRRPTVSDIPAQNVLAPAPALPRP